MILNEGGIRVCGALMNYLVLCFHSGEVGMVFTKTLGRVC